MCKTVLLLENFAVGVRAHRFFEGLACSSVKPLEEQMWNFDVLGVRDIRNAGASAARKSELVASPYQVKRIYPARSGPGSICGSGYWKTKRLHS
jgi:hypothetical protein